MTATEQLDFSIAFDNATEIKAARNALLRQFLCQMEESDSARRWQECARLMRNVAITGNSETDDRIRDIFALGYLSLGVLAGQVVEAEMQHAG